MLLDSRIQFLSILTRLLRSLTKNQPAFDDSWKKMKASHRSGQEDLFCSKREKAIQPFELATHGNKPHAKETQEFHLPMSFHAKPARAPYSCGPTFLSETDTYKEWKPGWWAPQGLLFLSCSAGLRMSNNCQRGRRRGETASSHDRSVSPWYSLLMVQTASEKICRQNAQGYLYVATHARQHRVKWKKRYWHHDNLWANICL